MKLSKEVIIHEAILILNESGMSSLTMRELASRLNIKAASLYWHIKNKEELFQLISESICENITFDGLGGHSRDKIMNVCDSYRINLLKVRDSVEIFNSTVPLTPSRVRLVSSLLNTLQDLGVKEDYLIQTGNLINNFVLSFVADELRMQPVKESAMEDFMGYPISFDFDQQFDDNLQVLLNGIVNSPKIIKENP